MEKDMGKYTKNIRGYYEEIASGRHAKSQLRCAESMQERGEILQKLREDFACSAGYFLITRYIEKNAKYEQGKLEYSITGEELGRKRSIKFYFDCVSRENIHNLSNELIEEYAKALAYSVVKNHHTEDLKKWIRVFKRVFKPTKKNQIMTKQEILEISHGLKLSYDEVQLFLLKVLEDEALGGCTSGDIIETFCFLYAPCNSAKAVNRLKEFYLGNDLIQTCKKVALEEKLPDWTRSIVGKGKNSLEQKIKFWEEYPKLPEKQFGDEEVLKDIVEEQFKEWMIENAKYIDVTSKTAFERYKQNIEIVYAKWYPEKFKKMYNFNVDFRDEKRIETNLEIAQDKINNRTACYSDEDIRIMINDIIEYVNHQYLQAIPQGQKAKKVLGYIAVDSLGELKFNELSKRAIDIFEKQSQVKKADLLLSIWLCCIALRGENESTQSLYNEFENIADDMLKECYLPELYVPHLLESTFMTAICFEKQSRNVFKSYEETLKRGMKEGISIEDILDDEMKDDDERMDIDIDEHYENQRDKRQQRNKLKKEAKNIVDELNVSDLLEKIEKHFLNNYADKGSYWFEENGVYYKKQHGGAFDVNASRVCGYSSQEIEKLFKVNISKQDIIVDENLSEEFCKRYKLLIYIGNYLSEKVRVDKGCKCNFRTICKEIPKKGTYIFVEKQSFWVSDLAGCEGKILEHYRENKFASSVYVLKKEGVYSDAGLVCTLRDGLESEVFDINSSNYVKTAKRRKESIEMIADYLKSRLLKEFPDMDLNIKITNGLKKGIRETNVESSRLSIVGKIIE